MLNIVAINSTPFVYKRVITQTLCKLVARCSAFHSLASHLTEPSVLPCVSKRHIEWVKLLYTYFTGSGGRFSKDPVTYRARKAILETMIRLPWKAALLICFRHKERQNNCQVSKLETCSYWRYKGIFVTRKVSGRSRNGPQVMFLTKRGNELTNDDRRWPIFIIRSITCLSNCCDSSLAHPHLKKKESEINTCKVDEKARLLADHVWEQVISPSESFATSRHLEWLTLDSWKP